MNTILAERTINVIVGGQPDRLLRAVVWQPHKLEGFDWGITISIHDPPEAPAAIHKEFFGVDAWQAIQIAFFILPVEVAGYLPTSAIVTFHGDENWSGRR